MKPLAFVLLALVGSMVLTSIPAQIFADPQLDSLLRIANQARDNIKIRLSQLAIVPNEISKLYEQGSAETDALAKSVVGQDMSSSKQHFLSAMRLFKEASDKISSSSPAIVGEPLPPTDMSRLKTAIIKMEKDAERLKALAAKNNLVIDFTEFDKLIQIARQNLDQGNADEVNSTLRAANQFILDAYTSLSATAKQRVTDRAKDFVSKQIEGLDRLIAQAKELGLSQDVIDTLQTAKAKLQKVSDTGQIVMDTKEINAIKEKIDESKTNRINAIIHQIEVKLDRLENAAQDNDSKTKIATTKDILVEVKQLVSDGKFDDALQKIKSIDEILNSIDVNANTTNESANTVTADNNQKASSNSDSKIERIKTKIQTLEDQANGLTEKVRGNDVAAQWLKRAFSLIDDAKNQLAKSPDKAMRELNDVDKILRMIQKMIS